MISTVTVAPALTDVRTIVGKVRAGIQCRKAAAAGGIRRLEWNRCSYVKDPATGRRVARVNPVDDREVVEVPELRIIDDDLWEAAKARQREVRIEIAPDEAGNALNRAHRRTFLLSGLLACGCCGGGYTIIAQDRYGCATCRGRSTCDNGASISRQRIEARVLAALRSSLLTPARVEEYVRAFAEEWAELERQAGARRFHLERALAETERGRHGVVRAIEGGSWGETIKERLDALELRKAEIKAELASLNEPAPARLHPNAAAIYAAQVAKLETALNSETIRTEAAEALRVLTSKVVLTPNPTAPDGLAAELHGDLAQILVLASEATGKPRRPGDTKNPREHAFSGDQLSVVAGTRNCLDLLLTG
jgi:hypothetical protein